MVGNVRKQKKTFAVTSECSMFYRQRFGKGTKAVDTGSVQDLGFSKRAATAAM